MPRPRKQTRNRWTRAGVDGYIRPRDGKAWMFYSTRRRTTGLDFDPVNKSDALDMLQEWVRDCKAEDLGLKTGPEVDHVVGELVDRYVEMRLPGKGEGTIALHDSAVAFFLRDIWTYRLRQVDRIATHLSRQTRAPSSVTGEPLADVTLHNYLHAIQRIFRLGVHLGWIDRDPVGIVGIPSKGSDGHQAIPYDIAEAAITHTYGRDRRGALCLELILLTGMRSHEARGLRLVDLKDDHILVHGKGADRKPGESEESHRRRKPQRIVPVWDVTDWPPSASRDWQQRLGKVVDELRDTDGPLLFPGNGPIRGTRPLSGEYLRHLLRYGLEQSGEEIPYTVHGLRKTAEHHFETVLEMDPWTFCDITGHDPATYVKRYRQQRTAADLMRAIARHGGMEVDIRTKPAVAIDRTHPHTGPNKKPNP